jgi:transcriptional regulator with XRE-family HTH domain
VADTNSIVKNLELQRQWYGEPLGDRVRRLVVAYRVSQACLAEVIGVSAPMLSQVMSGRRAKIGNPAALARLIMLEHRLADPGVEQGRPEVIQALMREVRESRPPGGRGGFPIGDGVDERSLLATIRDVAEGEDLAEAAARLREDFPALADLLRRAGAGE